MKRTRSWTALALALCLALPLTACSPKETLKNMIVGTVTALGFIEPHSGGSEEADRVMAEAGGDVTFPEGMDPTESRLVTRVEGDTLYVAFNSININRTGNTDVTRVEGDTLYVAFNSININRTGNTDYFIAGSDSVTITAYATTESPNENYQSFKVALWELNDDQVKTSYVIDSTVYYTADGTCYSYTVTGLTPGKQYKVTISYDSASYYVTGGCKVVGLGSEELTAVEGEATA